MRRVLNFFQYNNIVPISISFMLLGAGATFAATDPAAIISQQQQVESIDNSYIIRADIANYNFKLQVTNVTEDADNYYIDYTYTTVAPQDYVWQDVPQTKILTISKKELDGHDLGLFVSKQLGEVLNNEQSYLLAVQKQEQAKGESQKVVATAYSGLIGKFLQPHEDVFPGYVPVVEESVASSTSGVGQAGGSTAGAPGGGGEASGSSLFIEVLGNNPAQVPLNSSYIDLGAFTTDAKHDNDIQLTTYLNGTQVQQVQIDTSTTSVSTVRYEATDPRGDKVSAERKIYVYDPAIGPPVPDSQVQHTAPLPPDLSPESHLAQPEAPATQPSLPPSTTEVTPPPETPVPSDTATTTDTATSTSSATPATTSASSPATTTDTTATTTDTTTTTATTTTATTDTTTSTPASGSTGTDTATTTP